MLQQHIQFLYPQYLFQAHYSTPPKNVESDSILPIRNYLFSTCDEGLGTINGVQDPNLRSAKQGRRKQSVILCAYFLRISTLLNKHEIGNLGELLKNGQVVVCISTLNLYATCSANVKPYNPSGWQLRMLRPEFSEWCQNAYDSWLYISIVESPIPKSKVNKPHWLLMAGLLRQVFCYCSYCFHTSSKKQEIKTKLEFTMLIVRLLLSVQLRTPSYMCLGFMLSTQYLWSFWVSDPLAIKSCLKVVSGAVNPAGNGGVSPRYSILPWRTNQRELKTISSNVYCRYRAQAI